MSTPSALRRVHSFCVLPAPVFALVLFLLAACSATSGVSDDGGGADGDSVAGPPDVALPDVGRDGGGGDLFPVGDVMTSPDAEPGADTVGEGFGDPCLSNADCASGWCVGWDEGYSCTVLCIEVCPAGWECRQILNSQPDLVFACHPAESHLCRRCASDYECGSGFCVETDGERRCARGCSERKSCPAGYTCAEVTSEETGAVETQCVPTSGSCDCGPVDVGRQRSCSRGNEHGVCWGAETCDAELGWTGCSAPEPGPEECDALDNDCDGVADETPLPPSEACVHEVDGVGVCTGAWACRGATGWECTARFPSFETCDYRDEDCDGATDEDFRDPVTGAYVDLEHCGACNHSCAGAFPHGTERCDANGGAPACVIDECDPGYYLANPFTCLPPPENLCAPCVVDADCEVPGDVCVQQAEGGYCGQDCAPGSVHGEQCPDGYACEDVPRDGATLRQCVPVSGTCLCTLAEAGTIRTCQRSNPDGTCFGQQVCDPATGWSACDADVPTAEDCDGHDDDCDGYADEDVVPPGVPCEWAVEGVGVCTGAWVCGGAVGWECTADRPRAEACNYRDDDCDGLTDEGFTAEGTDRYVALDHCGACDMTCDGALPHATARCAGERPNPTCVVERCDAGYYQVSETSCAPVRDTSCTPCADDSGCPVPGDRCLDVDGQRFCARSCGADNPFGDPPGTCGTGFECVDDASGEGNGNGAHCLPRTGSCTCYLPSHDGAQRSCIRLGDAGLCTGLESCDPGAGWSACSARVPAPEVCNGIDDDCDGFLDEDVAPPAEPCRTTWTDPQSGEVATCDGPWVCAAHADGADWACRAAEAGPELCDGRDNDCDGATDEDFRDEAGLYVDFDHCGRCSFSCGAVGQGDILYAAETACDTATGVARCVVVSCEDGFYLPAGQTQVCLPEGDVADCSPCGEDVHCEALPGRCVDLDGGRFCARTCAADGDCPDGYACEDDGCVPDSGSCTCLAGHADDRRSCARENEFGHCSGFQVCAPDAGWSACDARTPREDTCNGEDDDCDGLVDEDLLPPGVLCTRSNEFGLCSGAWFCGEGEGGTAWHCDAPTPLGERCNHVDDDCDGSTDEDFRNAAGLYDDYDNCGLCGYSCDGAIPFAAVTACDASGGAARCVVVRCAPGFYQVSPLTCLPAADTSCTPCQTNGDCPVPGDVCLALDGGGYCARDCGPDNPFGEPAGTCGAGFACTPDTAGPGQHCLPETGSCTCRLPEHFAQTRICRDDIPGVGTCFGHEVCDPTSGWSACDAATPTPEICNGLDDDCDGRADEGLARQGTACSAANAYGTCYGVWVCGGEDDWACTAPAPAADDCDYVDDDCDGSVDEDFVDAASGAYVHDEHCGACGVSCVDAIPNATARCALHNGQPRCEVAACDLGYYQAGPLTCLASVDTSCTPCAGDDNCPVPGDRCLELDGARFCGRDCGAGNLHGTPAGACAAGFVCVPLTVDGDEVEQCLPTSGSCTCLADHAGNTRTCVRANDEGTCYGTETCAPADGWSACTARVPSAERCNGTDDNCNGATDDVARLGETCVVGAPGFDSTCAGVLVCRAGALEPQCSAPAPTEETCNYADDDCDDATDEDFPELYGSCSEGLGACLRHGFHDCRPDGAGTLCTAEAAPPGTEVCDGVDDDCDGSTDEGPLWVDRGAVCTVGAGICARTGVFVCDAANRAGPLVCSVAAAPAQAEVCNGVDDDCDGATDEDPAWSAKGGVCTVGAGICARTGVFVCDAADRAGPLVCSVVEGEPQMEVCNGVDDDCDGSTDADDADLVPLACARQAGVCEGSHELCRGAAGWQLCATPLYAAHSGDYEGTEVSCDGLDNDCDGATDDDLPTTPCAEQRGVCAGAAKACGGAAGWLDCGAERFGERYETDEATCDGLDNDCDGAIDEGLVGALCPVQAGVCEGAREPCRGDGGWYPCDHATYTAQSGYYEATEVSCDGLDNDCDGAVDDDLPQVPCAEQRGVCAGATKACGGELGWLACAAARFGADYEAAEATCDGLDNDCDGAIDEGLVGTLCPTQAGVCSGARQVCRGTAGWQTCGAALYAAYDGRYEATEFTCDGRDNDCDGAVDDDLPQVPCAERRGVCAGAVKTCGGAAGWLSCTAASYGADYETAEATCDGLDNDCDGAIDEGLVGALCPAQAGVCEGAREACRGEDGWHPCDHATYTARSGAFEVTEVSCDGLDNDCDGATDDDLPQVPCAEQRGVCAGATKACGATAGWLACGAARYGADYEATEATCDGLDNDCDGAIDEGLVGALCPAQGGVCAGARQVCRGTAGWQTCGAPLYAAFDDRFEAAEVTCDGLDNDCDGATDDDLPQVPCAEQRGVCAGATKACGAAAGWLACGATRYGADYEATEATCDGLDNDCDGAIDEGLVGTLCPAQGGVCAGARQVCRGTAGWQACGAPLYAAYDDHYEATEFTCDGLDNDCDGATDDDLPQVPCAEQRGVCAGATKACGAAAGWLACGATRYGADYEATEATCDGLDNDCDGLTDESWPTKGSVCAVGDGICRRNGVFVCDAADPGGPVVCDVEPGAGHPVDLCDYQDDDCDGATDEGYRDPTSGRYTDLENCGSCGNDCTQNYPSAIGIVPHCDAGPATPACGFTCQPGHVDADGVPENGCELTIDVHAIYVATPANGGDDVDGCGVWVDGALPVPCESIAWALGRAATLPAPPAGERRKVLVSDGAYEETVALADGIDVLGGYSHTSWSRDWDVNVTTILGAPGGAGDLATVVAQGIAAGATLEGFNVYGRIAETPGANSYAVRVVDSGAALVVRHNRIFAGYGAEGAAGTDGGEGDPGVPGNPGLAARDTPNSACVAQTTAGGGPGAGSCGAFDTSGGAGATSVCPGDWEYIAYWNFVGLQQPAGTSAPGGAAGGSGGFDGGIDPDYACSTCFVGNNPRNGADAQAGAHGAPGDGGDGAPAGSGDVVAGHWRGAPGQPGDGGLPGDGGGGGGAGGGVDINEATGSCATRGGDALGGSGGGGGAGACGGDGGAAGAAGGGAFAVYVVFTTPPATLPTIEDNVLRRGYGGAGGRGGAGGAAGIGGEGGVGGPDDQSSPTTWCTGHGGRGGRGGDGGHGGGGGGGEGGAAIGVFVYGNGALVPDWELANTFLPGGHAGTGGLGGEGLAGVPSTRGSAGAPGVFEQGSDPPI